ncbi:MAG: cupin domain-containing protein, partial [Candidatus Binatia bacterium]
MTGAGSRVAYFPYHSFRPLSATTASRASSHLGLPLEHEVAKLLPRIQLCPGPRTRFGTAGRIGPRLGFSLDQPESEMFQYQFVDNDIKQHIPSPPLLVGNHSKVIRHQGNLTWQDIPLEPYKETTESWKGVTRRELSGKRGESQRFHVRYFEIAPGGYTTLEKHEHEHVVVPLRGQGEVQFGCYIYKVGIGDVVYVAPNDPH